jgi:hypothetical protein
LGHKEHKALREYKVLLVDKEHKVLLGFREDKG